MAVPTTWTWSSRCLNPIPSFPCPASSKHRFQSCPPIPSQLLPPSAPHFLPSTTCPAVHESSPRPAIRAEASRSASQQIPWRPTAAAASSTSGPAAAPGPSPAAGAAAAAAAASVPIAAGTVGQTVGSSSSSAGRSSDRSRRNSAVSVPEAPARRRRNSSPGPASNPVPRSSQSPRDKGLDSEPRSGDPSRFPASNGRADGAVVSSRSAASRPGSGAQLRGLDAEDESSGALRSQSSRPRKALTPSTAENGSVGAASSRRSSTSSGGRSSTSSSSLRTEVNSGSSAELSSSAAVQAAPLKREDSVADVPGSELGSERGNGDSDSDSDGDSDGIAAGSSSSRSSSSERAPAKAGRSDENGAASAVAAATENASSGANGFRVDLASLVPGDHVVHQKLGICRFLGARSEVPPGREKKVKYLLLKFADGTAKLSAKQAKQVLYRYGLAGSPGRPVALSKLNDMASWDKKRAKGQAAVERMVTEMMELYVHRLRQRRPMYPKFREEMASFAERFPYEPTADQVQAFEDVERDMTERETPMDRLICGDVGFGKTEVALRAIFRAVLDGRQVMVLAPTTVLAKQHFNVISKRFAAYPHISVGLLSRFQKETEKRQVLDRIAEGSLQVVAGTHSLLGAQVKYHNLGLLVIDEEQRFGVRQKERISSLKTTVDVLTLSATPIPRTLYMSLHGFRDASRITTPPPERRPITTHVMEYDENVVASAIQHELDRDGQVFYVVPRVEGMEEKIEELNAMFPAIDIEMAHGQLRTSELERVMERFVEGETRLLVCTSIIESGIDIRTVNTIIIEDAHLFGMSQIYQLRGRVGRSDLEAHAYLIHPPLATLSSEAQERLVALRDLGGLGQGFELAQRDMDIRGIGDVFGERQSGDVGGVGYYLFMEMLHSTLTKVEQQSLPRVAFEDVKADVPAAGGGRWGSVGVPASYVPVPSLRERLERDAERAAGQGMQALLQFCNRMRREFGAEPPEMEMALKALFMRRIAADLGIHHLFVRDDGSNTVVMSTAMKQHAFDTLLKSVTDEALKRSLSFRQGRIELAGRSGLSDKDVLNRTLACLAQMRNALPSFVNYL